MTIAIILVLLVLGSLIFHYLSPWYFTPISSNWKGLIIWANFFNVPAVAKIRFVNAKRSNDVNLFGLEHSDTNRYSL